MIKIICVGKIKEKFFKDAINEYLKRLSKYTKLEIIELVDESTGDIISKEGIKILEKIKDDDYPILLDINGEMIDSLSFANKLDKLTSEYKNIVFIIGGSYGVSRDVKNRAKMLLSFSKLTFPHQLFRVVLLEQIYRAYKINSNEAYHK